MKYIILVGLTSLLILVGWTSYNQGYHDAKHKYCQHEESSISATKVNGKFVQSKPIRTGC